MNSIIKVKAVKVFAIVTLGALSTAYAQSVETQKESPKIEIPIPTVTVWGRVGGGVQYLSGVQIGAGNSAGLASIGSHWGTSIFGIKGSMVFDDKNSAQFWLENGFNSANGSYNGNKLFQRGAWVGMKNSDLGFLRFGQGTFIHNYIWRFDPFYQEDFGSSTFTNYRNALKMPNGLRYESPSFAGLEFAVQLNAGKSLTRNEGPSDSVVSNGRAYGGTVAYVAPQFEVRIIHDVIHNQSGLFDNLFVASKETFIGGLYKLGDWILKGGWSHYSAPDAPDTQTVKYSKYADHLWFGFDYRITPRWEIQNAIYTMKVGDGAWASDRAGEGRGTMYTLGTMYDLNKYAFFYATVGYVHNSSNANFSVRPSPVGYGDPVTGNGTSPMIGHGQFGMFTGVMYNFSL